MDPSSITNTCRSRGGDLTYTYRETLTTLAIKNDINPITHDIFSFL